MGARKILFLFVLHLLTGLAVSQELESKEAVKVLNRVGGINRFVHCSVYCPGLDILVLFGGLSEDKNIVAEPEVFDFATETWSRPNSTGDQFPVAKRTCSLQLLEATTTDCNVILVQSNKDSEFLETAISTITPTTDGEFELEWHNVLAASTPVAPRGRGDFCATSFKGSVYVYGGVNVDSPAATESFMNEIWQLDIGTNTTSGVFSSTWNKLGVASDPNKPIPVKQCAIAYVGTKIVLQGGSGFEGVSNQVLSFDVGSQQWNAFPSPASLDYLFSRALHSMVSYQGRVYSYGGYLLVPRRFSFDGVEYIYPTSLLSFTPIRNDMPQMDCRNADEKVDPKSALWCMYDESKGDLPVQDAIGASCVLRNSHMVCTTGVTTSTELSRGDEPRIIFFDLDIINKNLAIARERYAEAAGLVGSVYLFFAVICTISFIFWLMGMRDRQVATEMMNRQFPGRANRGARASVVAKIPLVEWQGEGTQPTPVVSENADDNGTSNTPASGITSHTPASSSEALEVTEIRVINQDEEKQIPVAENGESFEEYREMCSICLMEFEVGEHLRQLPCKHLFHPTCVDQWLTADKSCPLCKQDIDKLPGLRTPSMESINPSFSDADVETMQDGHGLLLSNTDRRWRNPMPNIRNPFRRQAAESGVTSSAM